MMPWVLRRCRARGERARDRAGAGGDDGLAAGAGAGADLVEIDRKLADSLKERMDGHERDGGRGGRGGDEFPDASFDSAVCFTMLHHVPSRALQDRLLAEAQRVLKPGGLFVGSDSTTSLRWRLFHLFDTCVPVEPEGFAARLERAGFPDAEVERQAEYATFKFCARKESRRAAIPFRAEHDCCGSIRSCACARRREGRTRSIRRRRCSNRHPLALDLLFGASRK